MVIKDSYLAIQTVPKWVAQVAIKDEMVPNPHHAETVYETLQDCIDANEALADSTDLGYRVSSTQIIEATDGGTALISVYQAFIEAEIDRTVAMDIVKSMQSKGVLFRLEEVQPEADESASDEPTEAPEGVSDPSTTPGEDG